MKAKKRILLKFDEMDKYLNQLDGMLPDTRKEYLQDLMLRRACEKTVELAIECIISISSIIISDKKLGVPDSEDDLIEIVKKAGIISASLAERLKQMKGFRNILVHKYGEIDDDMVYDYLTQEIKDFTLFEKKIKEFIKK